MKKEIVEKIVVENKIKKNDITEKKNIITNLQYNVKMGNTGDYEIKSTSSKIIYENFWPRGKNKSKFKYQQN